MAERQVTLYGDFSLGMNADVSPYLLAENELLVARNVELGRRGIISTRKGATPLNSSAYGSSPVSQLFEWPRDDGSVYLMAVIGNRLNRINTSSGAATDMGPASIPRVGYTIFRGQLYYVDGTNLYTTDNVSGDVEPITPSDDPENDIDPVKRCTMLVWHPKSMRFFAAGDPQHRSTLYYSEPNDPTLWKGTSRLVPAQADGPITALVLLADAVLVFFKNSIWVWRGIDPAEDVIWEKMSAPEGTNSPATIALTPMSLTFLGDGGLWVMSPSAIGLSGELQTEGQSFANIANQRMKTLLDQIVQRDKAVATYDARRQKYLLAFTTEESGPNDKVLEFDWATHSMVLHDGINIHSLLYRLDGTVAAGIASHIVQLNAGEFDFNGSYEPIVFEVVTPPYSIEPITPKRFQWLYVTFSLPNETLEVPCQVIVDGKSVLSVDLADHVDKPDDTDVVTARVPLNFIGERIQLRFLSAQQDPIALYNWAFEWTPTWRKGTQV